VGPVILHATTVTLGQTGVLIMGASGTGKSALGLNLMALGCALVADDRTIVSRRGETLIATCPAPIRNLIEARGIGLLPATAQSEAEVRVAVTLDLIGTERLPQPRQTEILGVAIPLLHKVETGYFAAAILQYLKGAERKP
jgi:HPr kinase/phosphorylase